MDTLHQYTLPLLLCGAVLPSSVQGERLTFLVRTLTDLAGDVGPRVRNWAAAAWCRSTLFASSLPVGWHANGQHGRDGMLGPPPLRAVGSSHSGTRSADSRTIVGNPASATLPVQSIGRGGGQPRLAVRGAAARALVGEPRAAPERDTCSPRPR